MNHLEWQLNENVVSSTSEVSIDQPTESDAGEYICIARFTDGTTNAISGGFLNIYCKCLVGVWSWDVLNYRMSVFSCKIIPLMSFPTMLTFF